MRPFIHLRTSSEFSISRGLLRVKELVDAAVKYKMPAIALTDLNNFFGLVKFISYAESKGVKPILGCILNVKDSFSDTPHEVLCLAKTNIGLRGLINLISISQNQIQNHKNFITLEQLEEFKKDIFIILGGSNSYLYELNRQNRIQDSENYLKKYMSVAKGNLLLEINNFEDQNFALAKRTIFSLASKLRIPVIGTNDCMFLNKEDFDIHEIKVCINNGTTLNDANRQSKFNTHQYIKNSKEMHKVFEDCKKVVDNTFEVATACNVSLKTGEYFLPEYPVPKGETFDSFLSYEAQKGLSKLLKKQPKNLHQKYTERLDYELKSITKTGFSSYFLIVADFIKWSKENDIPVGPGRGSGAGSLVAYCLDITELDPIEHDLLFERFINPERISMPDFDIDFCMDKRDQVISYVSSKYGQGAVSQIATFGTMAARAVVRDVARALGRPYGLGDRIAKMIPTTPGITLNQAIKSQPLFKQLIQEDDEVSEIIDLSFKLEGIARNVGKHAGGIVIAPGKITDFCPTYVDEQSQSVMTQFDKDDVETIGLVKFDFLGLRTLTVIDNAVKEINKFRSSSNLEPIDIHSIKLDDPKVFELLASGNTSAVFQLESVGMRDLIQRLIPTKFEEITALLALYRPGPLESGMHDEFVNRKHGKVKVTYPHDLLEPVLKETYGVILYQEQVMQAAQVLAGYSLGQADILRRAMGKKKVEEMEQQREIFVNGCKDNDINAPVAEKIFDLIEKFAGYGFNKSHSAAYALISYQTAYLKTYYPAYFMAAVLSSDLGNTDKVQIQIQECKKMGLKVAKPNINTSVKNFKVSQNQDIEYGLGAIKGVADSYITHLIEKRSSGFKDLLDLTKKTDIKLAGKKSIEALAKSGAFDSISPSRSIAIEALDDVLREGEKVQSAGLDLFSSVQVEFDPYDKYKNISDLPPELILEYEKTALGFYMSGHPVKTISKRVAHIRSHEIDQITEDTKKVKVVGLVNNIRQIRDRSGKPVMFISFDDGTSSMEGIIGSEILEKHHSLVKKGAILVFAGNAEFDDYKTKQMGSKMFKLDIKRIELLDNELSEKSGSLIVDLTTNNDAEVQESISKLKKLNGNFWDDQSCAIKLKVSKNNISALIKLGDQYSVPPTSENIKILNEIFNTDKISLGS